MSAKKMPYGMGAIPDPEDDRDFAYSDLAGVERVRRRVLTLPPVINNRALCTPVFFQGNEGSCVGMAMAGIAAFFYWKKLGNPPGFSPRAAYEWAKRYDTMKGEDYEGTTLRAGMKAWHRMGMCPGPRWPYKDGDPGGKDPQAEKRARGYPLWRYEKVEGLMAVRHAVHKWGAICVTIAVHTGWIEPRAGKIVYRSTYRRRNRG